MNRIGDATMRDLLKVYLIMGSTNGPADAHEVLREALAGGVTLFQLREKGPGALRGKARTELARSLQSVCRSYGVPFIVNDDIELALELDADGVHIGQDDEPASFVRARISSQILGVSVHTVEEAEKAAADGADYLGIGPIFATSSKEDAKAPAGTRLIRELRARGMMVPIVGIGGITASNADIVMADGADGVSVISAISAAVSPRGAAQKLHEAVSRI